MSPADKNFRDDERLHLDDKNVNIEHRVNKRTGEKHRFMLRYIKFCNDLYTLDQAEKNVLGSREYELISID